MSMLHSPEHGSESNESNLRRKKVGAAVFTALMLVGAGKIANQPALDYLTTPAHFDDVATLVIERAMLPVSYAIGKGICELGDVVLPLDCGDSYA